MILSPSNIDPNHHFVKFCKFRELIRENGVVIGVHPAAFELRGPTATQEQEKTVSGVYYEFCDGTASEKMCACFHFIEMEIKRKDVLARMGVGLIKAQGKKRSRTLRVRHEPDEKCLAYSAIFGLPVDTDDELCALLAADTIVEIVPASTF